MIPIALASPLWLISPGTFWKIVAMQIDSSGPCFIKLAQWLSTRRDIFSDELCECLSIMHESVEAKWSRGVTSQEVMCKLGSSDLRMKRIDDVAIASGSIAEVYFGELCDGTQVAVKCLRPSVRELLERDLAWMLHIGNVASKFPQFAMLGLRRAAEDFCEHVQMQVDFEIEAGNLKRFRNNFEKSGELVRFPAPLYASKEVLVLTREKGENLAQTFRLADGVASKRSLSKTTSLFGKASSPPGTAVRAGFCTAQEMNFLQARSGDIQEVLAVPAGTTQKMSG